MSLEVVSRIADGCGCIEVWAQVHTGAIEGLLC